MKFIRSQVKDEVEVISTVARLSFCLSCLFVLDQESQSDSQDEMAYLKRQVKLLTNQIEQQQQRITELRFRSSSPSPLPVGTVRMLELFVRVNNYHYLCIYFFAVS